jgi:hypothetical protein
MKSLVGRSSVIASIAVALLGTVPAAATTPVSFAPYQAYAVGSRAESVAIADVTADGLPDVLLTTSFGSDPSNDLQLFVFPQLPDGTLGTPLKYAIGQYSEGLDTGDLNGDGRADVAVATTTGIDVFYQAAAGGLLPPELIPTSNQAIAAVVADVNVDGRQDIVTNTRGGVFLLEQTDNAFATRLVTTDLQWEVEVGDLTGDGLPDIAGCGGGGQCKPPIVNVFEQRRSGKFRLSQYPGDAGIWAACGIGVGDVSGDGLSDVAMSICANQPYARLNVFVQHKGKLLPPVVYDSYDLPKPVAVDDVNGDNLGDVLTLHGEWLRAGVYLQEGGILGAESLFPLPPSDYGLKGLAVGDLNNDSKPDIAIADHNSGLVVLRQQ